MLLIWLLQMWYYFGKSLMEKEEVGKAVRCFQDSQAGEGLRASKEAGSEEGMWVGESGEVEVPNLVPESLPHLTPSRWVAWRWFRA